MLVMASCHSTTFGGNSTVVVEIECLVCYVISEDHVTKGSFDFKDRSALR